MPYCAYCGLELVSQLHARMHIVEAHLEIIGKVLMVADSPEPSWTAQVWPLGVDQERAVQGLRRYGFYADIGDS